MAESSCSRRPSTNGRRARRAYGPTSRQSSAASTRSNPFRQPEPRAGGYFSRLTGTDGKKSVFSPHRPSGKIMPEQEAKSKEHAFGSRGISLKEMRRKSWDGRL